MTLNNPYKNTAKETFLTQIHQRKIMIRHHIKPFRCVLGIPALTLHQQNGPTSDLQNGCGSFAIHYYKFPPFVYGMVKEKRESLLSCFVWNNGEGKT